jgi:sugar lactone lactonase YvrE
MRSRYLLLGVLIGVLGPAAAAPLAAGAGAQGATIFTVAGNGIACSTPPACGDGTPATTAQLSFPEGVAVDANGNSYIADWGDNEIRKLAPDGTISAVAGGGTPCSSPPACGDGGAATDAHLSFPEGVAVDQAGNVYIADTGNSEIRKVSPSGKITRFTGTGADCTRPPACGDGGAATAAQLSAPAGVAVDSAGNVYIADTGDSEIRKVSPGGKISRIAGTGVACSAAPSCGDQGPASSAQLNFPGGVAVDQAGNAYVADAGDNEVRKISAAGTIARVAGSGKLCSAPPACGDGSVALSAELSGPDGVAVTSGGAVFIADAGDNEIRRVSSAGTIGTIVGNASVCLRPSPCGDGALASTAQLNYPDGLAVDPSGNVYVADTYDHQLRWLSAGGASTIQGTTGKVAVSAFAADVSSSAVTARYALSAPAPVTLSVSSGRSAPVLVARSSGRSGFGVLSWNRRLGGTPAAHGRYTLTVTAIIAGHGASSKLSVRLS